MTLLLDVITALGTVVAAVGVLAALRQIRVMQDQLRDSQKWNTVSSAFEFLPRAHEFNEVEMELNKTFLRVIDRDSPLTQGELKKLLSEEHADTRIRLKNYLNTMELYCVAVRVGAIDSDVAKSIYGYKFERHMVELGPYILYSRERARDQSIWRELEETVRSWTKVEPLEKIYGASDSS